MTDEESIRIASKTFDPFAVKKDGSSVLAMEEQEFYYDLGYRPRMGPRIPLQYTYEESSNSPEWMTQQDERKIRKARIQSDKKLDDIEEHTERLLMKAMATMYKTGVLPVFDVEYIKNVEDSKMEFNEPFVDVTGPEMCAMLNVPVSTQDYVVYKPSGVSDRGLEDEHKFRPTLTGMLQSDVVIPVERIKKTMTFKVDNIRETEVGEFDPLIVKNVAIVPDGLLYSIISFETKDESVRNKIQTIAIGEGDILPAIVIESTARKKLNVKGFIILSEGEMYGSLELQGNVIYITGQSFKILPFPTCHPTCLPSLVNLVDDNKVLGLYVNDQFVFNWLEIIVTVRYINSCMYACVYSRGGNRIDCGGCGACRLFNCLYCPIFQVLGLDLGKYMFKFKTGLIFPRITEGNSRRVIDVPRWIQRGKLKVCTSRRVCTNFEDASPYLNAMSIQDLANKWFRNIYSNIDLVCSRYVYAHYVDYPLCLASSMKLAAQKTMFLMGLTYYPCGRRLWVTSVPLSNPINMIDRIPDLICNKKCMVLGTWFNGNFITVGNAEELVDDISAFNRDPMGVAGSNAGFYDMLGRVVGTPVEIVNLNLIYNNLSSEQEDHYQLMDVIKDYEVV